jgi:hypothetical protein
MPTACAVSSWVPEAVQDKRSDVLRLLLQWLATEAKDGNDVLCKLLCCSSTTTALVHDACAGQMTVHLACKSCAVAGKTASGLLPSAHPS